MLTIKESGLFLVLAWLALTQPVAADWAPSKVEMGALPPYCAARFDEKSEAFKNWRATMGSDFIHIHHYCAGLNFLNRARGMASTGGRQDTLGAVVREFDYVLSHASPGFYMRPEIMMNRGIALSMMKRNGEAASNLLKAIELDAKQPRAYMALADLYDGMKNRGKALETVTDGLRHNPGTKSLQRRYTELGGKLPYPAPIDPATAEAKLVKPDVAVAPTPANPDAPTSETPAIVPPAAEPADPPKIGSPKNPYCRFCPD